MLGYSNNPKANQETFDKVRKADGAHLICDVYSSLLLLYTLLHILREVWSKT
jgi:hypothetical protein